MNETERNIGGEAERDYDESIRKIFTDSGRSSLRLILGSCGAGKRAGRKLIIVIP